jgi:methylated-DNA-[protein]-cysteine S-methyltransferase
VNLEVPTAVGPLRLDAGPRGLEGAALLGPFARRPQRDTPEGAPPPLPHHLPVVWHPASADELHPDDVLKAAQAALLGLTARPIPLAPTGTELQRAVWQALLEIPRGETRSYRDVAARLGRPAAVRAVGAAVARNPFALFVPCHRVIGSGGALTGYAWGLERKAALLALEGARLT